MIRSWNESFILENVHSIDDTIQIVYSNWIHILSIDWFSMC